MGGKKDFVDSIFFPLKITLIPLKSLVYFCEMTFIPHIFSFCFSSYPNTLKEILSFPHSFFFSLLFFFLFSSFPFPSTEPSSLRASLTTSLNFYTVWRVNSCIYLLPIYIFKYTFQQTLYHFSIPFKYYFLFFL